MGDKGIPPMNDARHNLDREARIELLRKMLLIRAFDSCLPTLYTRGLLRGSSHAAIGQEAVAVGACAALRSNDLITSTHRGHGHAIAKGADMRRMMAELLGRATGYCRGKGGSMHIADLSIGMLGANGIVGGGFGIAAGAALTAQLRETDQVVVCFFGDGAINQGSFHGVANIAAIWKLPLILLCENNRLAMSARVDDMTSVSDLARRAVAYDIPGHTVDGMDPLNVHEAVCAAAAHARARGGPTLLIAECYRFEGHFSGDTMAYRDKAEAAAWRKRDPIAVFRAAQIANQTLTEENTSRLEAEAQSTVHDALEWARAQPLPAAEEALEDLYG
jgi:acetoin:2,6-dichlorophenolindophenol oxidoreductase subunit alpha